MVNQVHTHPLKAGGCVLECGCPNPAAEIPTAVECTQAHLHLTEDGMLVKCYHQCRNLLTSLPFWVGMTLGYPFEHALWHYVPPFSYISKWLGME